MQRRGWAAAAALSVAAVALLVAGGAGAEAAVLDNGRVALGITPQGHLIVEGAEPAAYPPRGGDTLQGLDPPPPSRSGTTRLGLRLYVDDHQGDPAGVEAIADLCSCEGWGVSYGARSGYTTFSTMTTGGPQGWFNLDPMGETVGPGFHSSTVGMDGLLVTHTFRQAPESPWLYEGEVRIRNNQSVAVPDLRYRRTLDWDVQPTAQGEYVTLGSTVPPPTALAASGTNGFQQPDPLGPLTASGYFRLGPPAAPGFEDSGPEDLGANFLFRFGSLDAGAQRVFRVYYGAAPTEAEAMGALQAVGAQVWSLGQASTTGGRDVGTPGTFVFAFAGVDVVPPNRPPTASIAFQAGATCDHPGVALQAIASDPDGPVASWAWELGDGSTASGPFLEHVYATAGTYRVRLTVTDDHGATAVAEADVASIGDPDCCPVLEPLPPWEVEPGALVSLRLRATDLDGPAITYRVEPMPTGARLDPESGRFEWVPGLAEVGTVALRAIAASGSCMVESPLVLLVVLGEPMEPSDWDRDGVADLQDNCPSLPNRDQEDSDLDGLGDACADLRTWGALGTRRPPGAPGNPEDRDADGVADLQDNCPTVPNRAQHDLDGDGDGDACDPDLDGDGVPQAAASFPDNCPTLPNADQADLDRDQRGDACHPPAAAARPGPLGPAGGGAAVAPFPWAPVAAAAALALLVAWRARRAGSAFLAIQFSRLVGRDLLAHPVRARIVEALREAPGLHGRELERRVGARRGAVAHHLRILCSARLVEAVRFKGMVGYRLAGQAQASPVARAPLARQVLEQVAAGAEGPAEIARRLGATRGAVHYHLQRLREAGLVPSAPDGHAGAGPDPHPRP